MSKWHEAMDERHPEIIPNLAQRAGIAPQTIAIVLDTFLDTIVEELHDNQRYIIPGFGMFSLRIRRERIGRDPQTGKEITLPQTKELVFRPGKTLKEKLT